jgi:hypothetical protein
LSIVDHLQRTANSSHKRKEPKQAEREGEKVWEVRHDTGNTKMSADEPGEVCRRRKRRKSVVAGDENEVGEDDFNSPRSN